MFLLSWGTIPTPTPCLCDSTAVCRLMTSAQTFFFSLIRTCWGCWSSEGCHMGPWSSEGCYMGPEITSSKVELFISPLAHWPRLTHGKRRANCKVASRTEGDPEQTYVQAEQQLIGDLNLREQSCFQYGSWPHFLVSVVRML